MMCSKDNLQDILEKIITSYKDVYGDKLFKVYLYGSYARGDNQKFSDVDIVAIVNGQRIDLQNKLKQVWNISADLELDYDTVISPTVIPLDEFNKYKYDIPYYANIVKEGVEISA